MKATDFRKRQEAAAREIEKLAGNLTRLKDQHSALDEEIKSAIDSDEFDKVEKLTAQMTDLENRIRAAEMIIVRKKETSEINQEEVIAANNAEMNEWQKRIDKAKAAADVVLNDYLHKLLDTAKLVNQAWNVRAEYIQLLPDIEDPYSINAQTTKFSGVGCHLDCRSIKWDELLTAINPDARMIIKEATRDRFNRYAGRK